MSINANNIFVGAPDQSVSGAVLRGDETDTIPASIDDFDWGGFEHAGHVTEDGVTLTPSESMDGIKDWSLAVVRKLLTEFSAEIAWSHLALDKFAAENYFGDDNVLAVAATNAHGNQMRMALGGQVRPRYSWAFKIKDGVRRVVVFVPHGDVGERGEIPLNASSAITLPVVLNTYPDTAGKNVYVYTDDGQLSA